MTETASPNKTNIQMFSLQMLSLQMFSLQHLKHHLSRRNRLPHATVARGQGGYSLTELFVVCVLLTILAGVAFPVARYTVKRQKEIELRLALRKMRNAIDEYKRYSDAGLLPVEVGTDGYPTELENLIEGIQLIGQPPDSEKKFLRRIPIDPMTGEADWGLRSYQDDFDATSWGGENVYDVYSLSEGLGLNLILYEEW